MKTLTQSEIFQLLETMSPEEIRRQEAAGLDEGGLELLAEIECALAESDRVLTAAGQQFREQSRTDLQPLVLPAIPWLRRCLVPNWVLTTAGLGLILVLFFSAILQSPSTLPMRTRSGDPLVGLQEKNEQVFDALLERGELLLQAGLNGADKELLKDALLDFEQAYQMNPDSSRLLVALVQVHEGLQNEKEAARFLEQWKNAAQEAVEQF